MKKVKYFIFSLICLFSCSIVYAENELVIKSITPVYDEASSVIVTETDDKHNVIFNDKNQSVKYNVVIENTSNKDLKVESINLTNPSEDFLKYELDGLKSNDVVKANTTKEVVISLSTVKQDGWGRNFDDELTATINFVDSIANPNTGTNEAIIVILICGVLISCAFVVICRKKKITKYIVILLAFSSVITITSAKESFVLPIKINVSYESQNVMKMAYTMDASNNRIFDDYWIYAANIKNIYIENEFNEIQTYAYRFDVSEKEDGKVIAYLVVNEEDSAFYDLYLQADGIIYSNPDAYLYFGEMASLTSIDNIKGFDTSNVTNMSKMFYNTGCYSTNLTLDLSGFDTSNVTDMSEMFWYTGYRSTNLILDLSSFDTSNVTDMGAMFLGTGWNSQTFTLDVSNFDTSQVTNMSAMFLRTGFNTDEFVLDLTNFDTRNVTNMSQMFDNMGRNSSKIYLDVSSFDTSKVTDMKAMFQYIGGNADNVTILLGEKFDTANVTDMTNMFYFAAYKSEEFSLDLSSLDTTSVVNTKHMFSNLGCASTRLNTSITIRNPNVTIYDNMFKGVATKPGSQIVVNYTKETETLVDEMIKTKSSNSNVVKGRNVDLETISFTIAGTTYYAEEGMTWEKWIGSVYNTDGYYLFDGNYPTSPNHYNISGVMASDEIVKDSVYNLDSMTVPS